MDKKRILVVDDEVDITFTFKIILEDKGFIVDTFNDSVLALSSFDPHSYDLALFDMVMPGMDGFNLYKEVKKLDSKIKILFLTASVELYETHKRDEFTKLDKELILKKPIDNEELIKRINNTLGS